MEKDKDHGASLGSDALASPAITEAHPTTILVIVVFPDGRHEEIDLIGVEGTHLNRINGANGREWWFDKNGYYDGWGQGSGS